MQLLMLEGKTVIKRAINSITQIFTSETSVSEEACNCFTEHLNVQYLLIMELFSKRIDTCKCWFPATNIVLSHR